MRESRSEYVANVTQIVQPVKRETKPWELPARNAARFRNQPAAKTGLVATIIGALRALLS